MNNIIKKIQDGDKKLANTFIKDNISYIKKFTSKYFGIFEDYDDLVQIAMIAFMKSIYTFKYNMDFLKQHAALRIYTEVNRYVLENFHLINDFEVRYLIMLGFYERCRKDIDIEITSKEISNYYGIKNSSAAKIIHFINNIEKYEDINTDDLLSDYNLEDECIKKIDTELFKIKFIDNVLTDKQKNIIINKYNFNNKGLTISEMARKINMTRQSLNNNHNCAIKKLKKEYSNELKIYMD